MTLKEDNNIYNNIYYNLRVLNEYFVNIINATCAAKLRRKYKKRKCYKCGVYGHIANECNNICGYCKTKHGNNICFKMIIDNSNEILDNLLPENCKRFIAKTLKFPFIGVKKLYPKKIRELERSTRGNIKDKLVKVNDNNTTHNKCEKIRDLERNNRGDVEDRLVKVDGHSPAYNSCKEIPTEWGQVESRQKATVYDILIDNIKTGFYLNNKESDVFNLTLLFYIKNKNPFKKISVAPMKIYDIYMKNNYRNILNPDFESHVKIIKELNKEKKKLGRIKNKVEKLKVFAKERQEHMENKLAAQRETFNVKRQFYQYKVCQLNNIKGDIINNLNRIKCKKLNDIRRLGRKVVYKKVYRNPNVTGESHRNKLLGNLIDMEGKLANPSFWRGRNETEGGKKLINAYRYVRRKYESLYGARGPVGPYIDQNF